MKFVVIDKSINIYTSQVAASDTEAVQPLEQAQHKRTGSESPPRRKREPIRMEIPLFAVGEEEPSPRQCEKDAAAPNASACRGLSPVVVLSSVKNHSEFL